MSAAGSVLLAAAVSGAATGAVKVARQRRADRAEGRDIPSFFSRDTAKAVALQTAAGLGGGWIADAYGEQIGYGLSSIFNTVSSFVAPAAEAAMLDPSEAMTPFMETTPPVCPVSAEIPISAGAGLADAAVALATPEERLARLAENGDLPRRTTRILKDAMRGNGQSLKDMAMFLWNGKGGLAVDRDLAAELYRKAADMGNAQASADLAWLQASGQIDAPSSAISTVKVAGPGEAVPVSPNPVEPQGGPARVVCSPVQGASSVRCIAHGMQVKVGDKIVLPRAAVGGLPRPPVLAATP